MGPMTNEPLLSQLRTHITNVVTKVGDAKITAVNIATQDATMTGCDYHPNVAEDATMADALATQVKPYLERLADEKKISKPQPQRRCRIRSKLLLGTSAKRRPFQIRIQLSENAMGELNG